ncbi:hypothetical protein [Tautonia plasticadhaerens]|uniref:Uncharacterized protein n=1 Tax=Tautonia plasticadhaerens TaxID=2527974 RepID=A0A518GUZ7_9BACT|nr:hypothetical protein [Tautonia plasticadhaerens]QDV32407.1 hypothetical protein ElP_02390 [Tautonia plasticadhaerens]
MISEPTRKFTVLDIMALVAAAAVGLMLARVYQASMDSAVSDSNGALTFPLRIRWFGRPAPLLASLTLALLALRFVAPRPRYRRLVRSPGFAACYGAALGLAITVLTVLLEWGTGYLGYSRPRFYPHFLMMRSVSFSAPSVASAWLVLGLLGEWRHRGRDWIEVGGIVLGVGWLALFAATQLNF